MVCKIELGAAYRTFLPMTCIIRNPVLCGMRGYVDMFVTNDALLPMVSLVIHECIAKRVLVELIKQIL